MGLLARRRARADRHRPGSLALSGVALGLAVGLVACSTSDADTAADDGADGGSTGPDATTALAPASAGPGLDVKVVMSGLSVPWDIGFLPGGAMLVTERDEEQITWRAPDGSRQVVLDSPRGMWHGGETGLMSVVASPQFGKNRTFYTCHGFKSPTTQEVRVVRWRLGTTPRKARFVSNVVTGLPSSSGRHGGCQLAFGRGGDLFVGTGDAAEGTNPQDLTSGGGKVLRVDPVTGRGVAGNPFPKARNAMKRRVLTYGHRNVQGLAVRADGRMWSAEHGSYRDDEVNLLKAGANMGWNPVPGYNEEVPMTDFSLPGKQRAARWSSGDPTIAPSGISWLPDTGWGAFNGAMAMSVLKDSQLRILKFGPKGTFLRQWTPEALAGADRLRASTAGPGGALYLTTSNDDGNDRVLKVTPRR